MKIPLVFPVLVASLLALCSVPGRAESFHVITIDDLPFVNPEQEGLKDALESKVSHWRAGASLGLRLPDSVEAYLAPESSEAENARFQSSRRGSLQVALRFADTESVSGFGDLAETFRGDEQQAFAITLDPAKLKVASKEDFEKVRGNHYQRLADSSLPGKVWFRQRAGDVASPAAEGRRNRRDRVESELSPTFAMFSGGRAISENLALDRELILGRSGDASDVPIADIKGIKVKAIDWKARLPEQPVEVDALAKVLPLDQHAVFIPSTAQFFKLVDLIEKSGAPVFGAFDVRNPFRDLPSRYLERLGLGDREDLMKLPITRIALTGSDPFFPSGTDVVVVFESTDPAALLAKLDRKNARLVGEFVVVSNSNLQLDRIASVGGGVTPSLGNSDEFQFFRHRYPLGAEGESAFAFLSDATIRRWGSPRFRIGASRRSRAMAALGALTAKRIAGEDLGDEYSPLLGKVVPVGTQGVRSDRYGRLGAITPLSALEINTVTATEKAAYENWRRGYESGWARVFDPIAIRLALDEESHGLDLTILPLTIDSEYRSWLEVAGKAKLSAMARKVHDGARLFASFAIDSTSIRFQQFDQQLSGIMPGLKVKPLAWVGESLTVFLDDGFFWKVAAQGSDDYLGFPTDAIGMLPIGIRVESKSSIKLALFLGALKGLAETSSPDLLRWETRKHGERSYVAVVGNGDQIGTNFTICYAATPKALLVSLDEDLLKRAIEREEGAKDLDADGLPEADHAFLKTSPQFLAMLGGLSGDMSLQHRRRLESWRALPILNEWRRLQPGSEPGEFHRDAFGEDISCPGGKGYRWNAEAMTMESVAYGYPAAPRDQPVAFAVFEKFNTIAAGLGFEDDGLRLWAKLGKQEDPKIATAAPALEPAGEELATAAELTPQIPGSVFKYRWRVNEDEDVRTVEVLEPGQNGEKRTLRKRTTRNPEGEEPEIFTSREVLDGDLHLLGQNSKKGHASYTSPLLLLPERLLAGEATVSEYAFESVRDGEEHSGVGMVTFRPIKLEEVETVAGTFENCVRVELVQKFVSQGHVSVTRETIWLKAGVGLVKLESKSGDDFSMTSELIEYRIPEK